MTINSEWIRKDFKQKYFLYCKDCVMDKITPQKVAQVENKLYISQIIITERK